MKITPLDIRQKTFAKKTLGGVDKEEVSAYLQSLAGVWEKLLEENRELRIRLESAEKDGQKLRELENTLYMTLRTAEETSLSLVDQANREAELKRKEADMHSASLLTDAENQARLTIEEAQSQANETIAEANKALNQLHMDYLQLETYRDVMLNDLYKMGQELITRVETLNNNKPIAHFEPAASAVKPERGNRPKNKPSKSASQVAIAVDAPTEIVPIQKETLPFVELEEKEEPVYGAQEQEAEPVAEALVSQLEEAQQEEEQPEPPTAKPALAPLFQPVSFAEVEKKKEASSGGSFFDDI